MKGRIVLITGATSGIGSEIAFHFAKNGWNTICQYNSSEEKANKLCDLIRKEKVDCHLFRADFTSYEEIMYFINEIEGYNVDTLVNNAGTYIVSKHFSKLTLNDILATFMVNTYAPIFLVGKLFAPMKNRKFGRIVNISSVAAKYGGSAHSMHYGCSKRSLEGLTKTIAKEGAQYNVLANTVRPGVIDTEFHKKYPKDMDKRISLIPVKKMGTPKDIAEIVYYLGSHNNNFITNQIITISGGE